MEQQSKLKEASLYIEELQEGCMSDLDMEHPHLIEAAKKFSVDMEELLYFHEKYGFTAQKMREQFWEDGGMPYDYDGGLID